MRTKVPLPKVWIYSDGGCRPNPGNGGWAFVTIMEDNLTGEFFVDQVGYGHAQETTNQQMELQAVIQGIERLESPHRVNVMTDSRYVWECASGKWQRKANLDLWERFDEVSKEHEIQVYWLRRRSGDKYNEYAHSLVQVGITEAEEGGYGSTESV